jgi:hypothetical protein
LARFCAGVSLEERRSTPSSLCAAPLGVGGAFFVGSKVPRTSNFSSNNSKNHTNNKNNNNDNNYNDNDNDNNKNNNNDNANNDNDNDKYSNCSDNPGV